MMEKEIKNLLEENLEISKKSFVILEKLHKAEKWRWIFAAAKWALIIGLIIFGLVRIQPYLLQLTEILSNIAGGLEELGKVFPTR